MRKFWFWIHWFIGIVLFLFLSITALSGAVLSFQDEILSGLNRQDVHVNEIDALSYLPSRILKEVQAHYPQAKVSHIHYERDHALPWVWIIQPGQKGHEGMYYVPNPLTDELTLVKGMRFFGAMNRLHRTLMQGQLGKNIVALTTVGFLLLIVSGIYMYWGSLKRHFFASLKIDFTKKGKAFLYRLHSALGMWVVPWYLLICLSGLYWSYGWYAQALHALSGIEVPMKRGGGKPQVGKAPQPSLSLERLDAVWTLFRTHNLAFESADVMLSLQGKNMSIRYVNEDAPHQSAFNTLSIDTEQMRVVSDKRYDDLPVQAKLIQSMSSLHSGAFFGWIGRVSVFIVSLSTLVFVVTGWMLYLKRRHQQKMRTKES